MDRAYVTPSRPFPSRLFPEPVTAKPSYFCYACSACIWPEAFCCMSVRLFVRPFVGAGPHIVSTTGRIFAKFTALMHFGRPRCRFLAITLRLAVFFG